MKRIFDLLVLLIVLSIVFGLVTGLLRHGEAVATTSMAHAVPMIPADVVVILMAGVFFVGLGARVHQFLTGHGGRAGREHDARERQVRLTVRRLAEGVPATTAPELPDDPDPAIAMEEN